MYLSNEKYFFRISTTWWVLLLVDFMSSRTHIVKSNDRLRFICTVSRASETFRDLIEIYIMWVYFYINFGFELFGIILTSHFNVFKLYVFSISYHCIWRFFLHHSQEQITQSLLCIPTTGSNDLERSDTKLEAPSFPIEYKIFCSTFYAKPYINRFCND